MKAATALLIIVVAVVTAEGRWDELQTDCNESHAKQENKYSQDKNVAVAREGVLELMTADGTVVTVVSQQFKDLTAVTYDPASSQVFLSDSSHINASIFQIDVNSNKVLPLVPKQVHSVQGIAYDPDSASLFWTNGRGRAIFKVKIAANRLPTTLVNFTDKEIPMGIALDPCDKLLYWTNSNHLSPSIERARLDGTGRQVVISENLFQPLGIAVDLPSRRLYWSDDQEGIYFKIERSNLDGSNRKTLLQGTHHQPFSLSVGPEMIFWSDWIYNAVWSLPKHGGDRLEPTMVRRYRSETPMGLVANVSTSCVAVEQTDSAEVESQTYMADHGPVAVGHDYGDYCLHQGELVVATGDCRCRPGHSGPRCEVQMCFNFCLQGSCYLDPHGLPQCQCERGFKGDRCQVDICQGYCLNEGKCRLDEEGGAVCVCQGRGGEGPRCEGQEGTSDNATWAGLVDNACGAKRTQGEERIALVVCACAVVLLALLVAALGRRLCVMKKRPRIRKQIIVKKNVTPLTSRPAAGEQCEITIENCCNMNICETPCFEPQLRSSKTQSKKEEKTNLLGSMEEEPTLCDDLY